MSRSAAPAPAAPAQAAGPERTSGPHGTEPELVAPDGRRPIGRFGPRDLLALQQLAGNAAVAGLIRPIQRDSAAPTTRLPPARLVKSKKPRSQPLVISGSLLDAISQMPELMRALKAGRHAHVRGSSLARGATEAENEFEATITRVTLVVRDAIYNFDPDGKLVEVDSNLSTPVDPAHPDDLPAPKMALPADSSVFVLDPATGRKSLVVVFPSGQVVVHELQDQAKPEAEAPAGTWEVYLYAPAMLASEEGGPQPGFRAKAAADKGAASDAPPRESETQLDRVRTMLRHAAETHGDSGETRDAQGSGSGLSGAGPGGGGTDHHGTGTGMSGTGSGASTTTPGAGRGGAPRPRDRAAPDKVVMYQGKHGTNINVWKGGTAESIPYKDGESDASLLQRIEEAAARLLSTGKRLADGGADTGFLFGHGGGTPSAEDLAEATDLTANAMAYPSKISMQGGSGDEVSPRGWATTVAGADHDFDMVLDWDAIQFGLANQTFARLGWISYFWEVVDVSQVPIDATKKDSARAGARDAAKDKSNVRVPSKLENFKSVGHTVEAEGEGIEADSPTWKLSDGPVGWAENAGQLAVEGISATWDIAKGLVGAWIARVTQPENRQSIHLKDPGEYVIRCLANPYVNSDKPEAQRTIRATSIAAFPVRVLEVDTRAREVNRSDTTEINGLETALARARAELEASPGDPGKQAAVDLLGTRLSGKKKDAARTTTQKLADDAKGLNDEFAALNQLIQNGGNTEAMTGDILAAAMRIKNEEGLLAPWQWDMRRQDVDKALAAKIDQAKQAGTWSKKYLKDASEEIRPQVTFVSEENGAVVRMAMILGPADGTTDEHPKWVLLDVTSPSTQGKFFGTAKNAGAEGHAEAIAEAFKEFSEKGEYGRGTIAIALPKVAAVGGTPSIPDTLPMRPGRPERWMKRLQNIVEIAGLVAPFVEGGVLAEVASIGGAAEAGYHLYERAAADRLHANFETLTDIVGMLAPFISGAKALSELEGLASTKTGYVLKVAARGGELVSEYIVPISVFHDLEQVMADKAMGGPEKQASVAMIIGRAMRDKVLHLAGETLRSSRQGPWEADEPTTRHDGPGKTGGTEHGTEEEPLTGAGAGAAPKPEHGPGPEPEPEPKPEPIREPIQEPEAGHGGGSVGGGGPAGGHGGGGGDGPSGAWTPGMPKGAVEGIKEMSHHYGITIDLRAPTVFARSRLARGALAKPVEIKAKTINRADVLLGAPEGALGLVGYFEPKQPSRPRNMGEADWVEVEKRFTDRLEEYDDLAYDMHRRVKDGSIRIVDGIVWLHDPRGPEGGPIRYRPVTGDVDLYQIHWADGRPMTTFEADVFAGELRKWGIGVEHGAHLRWRPRNEHEQKVYDKVVAAHDPGKAPLLRFEPGEEPQRVDNATPINIRPGRAGSVELVGPEGGGGPAGAEGPSGGPGGGPHRPEDPAATAAGSAAPVPRGSDLDQEPDRPPSVPTGAVFSPRPASRYRTLEGETTAGTSKPVIVEDTVRPGKYLFKPSDADQPIQHAQDRGIKQGDYAARSAAAEIAADMLGIETPHVELVQIGDKRGSLTEWFDRMSLLDLHDKLPDRFNEVIGSDAYRQSRDTIEALDYLINNVDRNRNLGNYLVEFKPDGSFSHLIPVDHDVTFTSTRARAQVDKFTGDLPRTYTPEMVAALKAMWQDRARFTEALRPLVGDEAIPGVLQRLDELVADAEAKDFNTRPRAEPGGGAKP